MEISLRRIKITINTHKITHVHSARHTRMLSQTKNRGKKFARKLDGLPENPDEDISIHNIHATMENITFQET